jgi:integrase/recombinase XerD
VCASCTASAGTPVPRGACVRAYHGKRGVVWRIQFVDAGGSQLTETLGAERDGWTRRRAEDELRERLVRVERKGYRRPAPLSFDEYSRKWFGECKTRRNWKPGSVVAYTGALKRLGPFFGPRPLGSIRPRDVVEFIREALVKGYAAKTINLDLNVLHDVFKTARREELVDANPVENVERPRVPRRRWRILQPVEVARVAKAFGDEQARLVFLTLMLTGIRRFELWSLRWRDVDLIESVMRIRDSKSEEGVRSIALAPALAEEFWQHRRASKFHREDELVFCNPKRGSRIDPDWFAAELRAALAAAGVDGYVRPFHDLRHASLTNGAAAGEQPLELMTRAGHRSMATTKQYLHLAGVVFPDAAKALEQRFGLGGGKFHPSQQASDTLGLPHVPVDGAAA